MTFSEGPFMSAPFGARPQMLFSYTIPVSETPEGKLKLQQYYEALGRFIALFAEVEAAVTFTLRLYTKIHADIAKIVFASRTMDNEMNLILELVRAPVSGATDEKRKDLEYVFKQLRTIKEVRNAVLHFGATAVAEGQAVVSNAIKAKGAPKVFPISPENLTEMTDDLRKIAFHINYRHLGRPMPRSADVKAALEGVFQSNWKYEHLAK